jgi:hypothetical protein
MLRSLYHKGLNECKYKTASPILFPNDVNRASFDDQGNKAVEPMLVGCIDYQFPASGKRHQTRFIYDVFDKSKPSAQSVFITVGKTVPKDQTRIGSAFCGRRRIRLLKALSRQAGEQQLCVSSILLPKIEVDVANLVHEAKLQWERGPIAEQALLFADSKKTTQDSFRFDQTGITDEQFWTTAEKNIYDALGAYAGEAETGYVRRLFAEDASHGFAFIDLCRRRYDIVLMNPPFGEPSVNLLSHLGDSYSDINKNLLCAFLKQGFDMLIPSGRLGAIYDRTAVIKNTYEGFRRSYMVSDCRLTDLADLGWEVLTLTQLEVEAWLLKRYHPQ